MFSSKYYTLKGKWEQSINLWLFCLIFPTNIFAQSLTLIMDNQSSHDLPLTYISANTKINPMPRLLLAKTSVSLDLSSQNFPIRANIALKKFDINVALFNNQIRVTYCEYTELVCDVDHQHTHTIIHFKDRY